MQRLLRGPALAVDRHRGHAVGKRGRQHDVAPQRKGLLADLADAADDDIVDRRRIDPGFRDDRVENARAEIGGMDSGEPPVAALRTIVLSFGRRALRGHAARANWLIAIGRRMT